MTQFNFHQALENYKEAISLIDKAMLIPISMPSTDNAEETEDVNNKMRDLKKMIYNFKMQRQVLNSF